MSPRLSHGPRALLESALLQRQHALDQRLDEHTESRTRVEHDGSEHGPHQKRTFHLANLTERFATPTVNGRHPQARQSAGVTRPGA